MEAIVYKEYGSPDVLRLEEVDTPTPEDDEILIKVRATPVNYGDLTARNFKNISAREFNMPAILWFPAKVAFGLSKPRHGILGSELSGVVEAVGAKVTRFAVGDEVFAYNGAKMGANAEYLCMPESGMVAHKPSNMSFEEAAAVPYGGITAASLLGKVDLQPGQKILINGASGGIGSMVLQLAKHAGAEVTGVCSTPRVEYVRSLGADHVIDYTKEDFTRRGETYDVVFDVLGRSSFDRVKRVLEPGGRYLLASFKMDKVFQMLVTSLVGDKKVICALADDKPEELERLRELAEAGEIKTLVDRTFPLEEAAEAHRYVESGQRSGQVVLTVGQS